MKSRKPMRQKQTIEPMKAMKLTNTMQSTKPIKQMQAMEAKSLALQVKAFIIYKRPIGETIEISDIPVGIQLILTTNNRSPHTQQ
jgi:hypothetical protein